MNNPCGEISLSGMQICILTEPEEIDDSPEFWKILKAKPRNLEIDAGMYYAPYIPLQFFNVKIIS